MPKTTNKIVDSESISNFQNQNVKPEDNRNISIDYNIVHVKNEDKSCSFENEKTKTQDNFQSSIDQLENYKSPSINKFQEEYYKTDNKSTNDTEFNFNYNSSFSIIDDE